MNRPQDVCALCDHAITADQMLHLYLGPGWVHGGGRECIPVHWHCAVLDQGDGDHGYPFALPGGQEVLNYVRRWLAPDLHDKNWLHPLLRPAKERA